MAEQISMANSMMEIMNNSDKPEYIICAAIHFNDKLMHIGQPLDIEEGFVLCGRRHHDVYLALQLLGRDHKDYLGGGKQGFLSSKNKFYGRNEAWQLAMKAGQIRASGKQMSLISEDLY